MTATHVPFPEYRGGNDPGPVPALVRLGDELDRRSLVAYEVNRQRDERRLACR